MAKKKAPKMTRTVKNPEMMGAGKKESVQQIIDKGSQAKPPEKTFTQHVKEQPKAPAKTRTEMVLEQAKARELKQAQEKTKAPPSKQNPTKERN